MDMGLFLTKTRSNAKSATLGGVWTAKFRSQSATYAQKFKRTSELLNPKKKMKNSKK